MDITSKSNNVKHSPKKLRKVANCVRGLNVNKALSSLRHMNEKGATIVEKTLSSAIANAGNTENFDKDMNEVKVKIITVDEGPPQKRFRARAQGRANRIKKRTSHLKIVIG
jgi:large subunit ribosomal protein L22|tara:strand:+ start:5807 stop:6139 length:333 start_codon:yes stop_codon:yes gene_type:complete